MSVFLDTDDKLDMGERFHVRIDTQDYSCELMAAITAIKESRLRTHRVYTLEILDYKGNEPEYLEILYDRIPTLPQNLNRDMGVLVQLWNNIAGRISSI